jgi:hypothetical protein
MEFIESYMQKLDVSANLDFCYVSPNRFHPRERACYIFL